VDIQADAGDRLRQYPVLPAIRGGIASRARALYRRGIRLGNRRNVFSKIGDSNTAFGYFLQPIGTGGLQLGGYGNLQPVVDFFGGEIARTNNSFANESLAAFGGWNSSDLLNPDKAVPGACQPGETPVACELRVTRPSVALIMIGTNDLPGGDVKSFRRNLNQIVTITEQHGVIPVISTIPYRKDSDTSLNNTEAFNLAIVSVARAHAAPLWNYWLAVDSLPDNGVSNDRVHPSVPGDQQTAIFDESHLQFGFTMRNLTALQVLERLLPILK
jgi:hypothetical protein